MYKEGFSPRLHPIARLCWGDKAVPIEDKTMRWGQEGSWSRQEVGKKREALLLWK